MKKLWPERKICLGSITEEEGLGEEIKQSVVWNYAIEQCRQAVEEALSVEIIAKELCFQDAITSDRSRIELLWNSIISDNRKNKYRKEAEDFRQQVMEMLFGKPKGEA